MLGPFPPALWLTDSAHPAMGNAVLARLAGALGERVSPSPSISILVFLQNGNSARVWGWVGLLDGQTAPLGSPTSEKITPPCAPTRPVPHLQPQVRPSASLRDPTVEQTCPSLTLHSCNQH